MNYPSMDIVKFVERVLVSRRIQRCIIMPTQQKSYNVSEHSHLVAILNNIIGRELAEAGWDIDILLVTELGLFHDTMEYATNDVPFPFRNLMKAFGLNWDQVDEAIYRSDADIKQGSLSAHNIHPYIEHILTHHLERDHDKIVIENVKKVLEFCDRLEGLIFTGTEIKLGNRHNELLIMYNTSIRLLQDYSDILQNSASAAAIFDYYSNSGDL